MPVKKEPEKRERTSFALLPSVKKLLAALADHLGRSQANTIETLIKEAAKKEKIK